MRTKYHIHIFIPRTIIDSNESLFLHVVQKIFDLHTCRYIKRWQWNVFMCESLVCYIKTKIHCIGLGNVALQRAIYVLHNTMLFIKNCCCLLPARGGVALSIRDVQSIGPIQPEDSTCAVVNTAPEKKKKKTRLYFYITGLYCILFCCQYLKNNLDFSMKEWLHVWSYIPCI